MQESDFVIIIPDRTDYDATRLEGDLDPETVFLACEPYIDGWHKLNGTEIEFKGTPFSNKIPSANKFWDGEIYYYILGFIGESLEVSIFRIPVDLQNLQKLNHTDLNLRFE